MRRKLIKQDDFDQMKKESITTAERELSNAEPILADALGRDHVSLHTFTENTVTYATPDNTYVHAGYELNEENVTFNNIQELVVDHESRRAKGRALLGEMLDAVLIDETAKAKGLFSQYLELVNWSDVKESVFDNAKKDLKEHKSFLEENTKESKERIRALAKKAGVEGLAEVALNVLEYTKFMNVGPALSESITKQDNTGNITDLRIPNSSLRNENRLFASEWKILHENVKGLRNHAAQLAENQNFCKACAELKRQNAFADYNGLEEVLESIVKTWPNVLYVTESELAQVIGHALQTANVKNYDDQTCAFMAEGILRKAHSCYTEKVEQVLHLSSAPKAEGTTDAYEHFQSVVAQFYPHLDEKFGLERKVFTDLYESLKGIYGIADRRGNQGLKNEAASYLNELADILNGESRPDVELAEEAANWITRLIETNLETGTWNVSNSPHMTVSGDHPDMAKKAAHPYKPSSDFSGNWGDPLPMISQDNMSYKGNAPDQARSNSWASASTGGGDVFPKLNNPYVPKPFGQWTMKGETGVDKDATGQHWSTWRTADTWPDLDNPYVPKEAGGPGGTGHKMKDGSETDLVVDR
jgi:hypothetical protein